MYNKSYEVMNNINNSIIDNNKFKTDVVDLLFEICNNIDLRLCISPFLISASIVINSGSVKISRTLPNPCFRCFCRMDECQLLYSRSCHARQRASVG